MNEDVKEGESTFSSTSTSTPTTSTSANQSSGKPFLRFSGRYGVFALGSSAYPNFCAYGKYLDTVLAELGGERVSRLGTGDELCGQEQSFNEWATTVFEAAADVFCLTDDLDMSEVMKKATLKPLLWSKENVRLEAKEVPSTNDEQLKEQNKVKRIEQGKRATREVVVINSLTKLKPTAFSALSKLSNNKKVMHYKLLEREFLHEVDSKTANVVEANLRQTIRVSLQTDLNQTVEEANEDDRSTAYYLPGDHLAVYPQNEAALVSALIKRLTSQQTIPSPSAADRPYLVKIRSQQSMENGGSGAQGLANGGGNNSNAAGDDPSAWTLHDRLPAPVSLREALTRYLDITTPPTQQFLAILAETATESAECAERMKHLARDSTDYETWKAKSFPNLIEVKQEMLISVIPNTESLLGPARVPGHPLPGAHLHAAAPPPAPLLLHLQLAALQLCLPARSDGGRGAVHHRHRRRPQRRLQHLPQEHSRGGECLRLHPQRAQLSPAQGARRPADHGRAGHGHRPLPRLLGAPGADEVAQPGGLRRDEALLRLSLPVDAAVQAGD